MWYLLYTDPGTGERKWEKVSVDGSDAVLDEVDALAKRVGVDPENVMAFFEGDNYNE